MKIFGDFSQMMDEQVKLVLEQVGAKVQKLRKEKDLSLRDFANLGDKTDHAWVSEIEKGLIDIRISTLVKLADILQVDICELLDCRR